MTVSIQNLGSDTVAEYTDISVTFVVSNFVEQDGTFELGIGKWNPGTPEVGLEEAMIVYDVTQPIGTLLYSVPCSSTDHPNIQCTFSPAEVVDVEDIATARDILSVTGLNTDIQAGGSFNFRTLDSSFHNPPTTQAYTAFEGQSRTALARPID